MSWLFGSGTVNDFEEVLEKATSEMIPAGQEDLALELEICDRVRGKQVPPKEAMRALKKRLAHRNPNVQLLALKLADLCVKNGGGHFLVEVASREFMDHCVAVAMGGSTNPEVTRKLLGYLQSWATAFQSRSELSYVGDTVASLRAQGLNFPPAEKTDAIMIDTSAPPDWTDSDVCMRCRQLFTLTNRKHHCRACGKTFCQPCSARNIPLPDIGINQDVRVCDGCFTKRNPDATSNVRFANPIASTYPGASAIPRHDDAAHREEDELQRAIAASLMESQRGEREAVKAKAKAAPVRSSSKQPVSRASGGGEEGEEEDPELAAAIAASLRESERNSNYKAAASSAKTASKSRTSDSAYEPARSSSQTASVAPIIAAPANPNDLTPAEMENIRLFHALIEKMDADPSGAASRALPGDRDMRMMYEGMASVGGRLVRGIEECVERHRIMMDLYEKLTQSVHTYDRLLEDRRKQDEKDRQAQAAAAAAAAAQQHHAPPYGYGAAPPVAGYYGQQPPPQQQQQQPVGGAPGYYGYGGVPGPYYAPPPQGYPQQPPPQQYPPATSYGAPVPAPAPYYAYNVAGGAPQQQQTPPVPAPAPTSVQQVAPSATPVQTQQPPQRPPQNDGATAVPSKPLIEF